MILKPDQKIQKYGLDKVARHNKLGELGEQLAVDHLIAKGYQIIERNWRYQKAEIDIMAQKNEVLAVVEVKTRSTDLFGDPQDFVNKKKIGMMVNAVDHYVCQKDLDVQIRFDIIAIIYKNDQARVMHLEDAFFHVFL